MALATVNIDKIIIVTSASSYVLKYTCNVYGYLSMVLHKVNEFENRFIPRDRICFFFTAKILRNSSDIFLWRVEDFTFNTSLRWQRRSVVGSLDIGRHTFSDVFSIYDRQL